MLIQPKGFPDLKNVQKLLFAGFKKKTGYSTAAIFDLTSEIDLAGVSHPLLIGGWIFYEIESP